MSDHVPWIALVLRSAGSRGSVARALELAGYRVREGESEEDAMRLLAEHPSLILLGDEVGEGRAAKLCSRLKSAASLTHVPVVLLATVQVTSESQAEALEHGADACLTAPFELPVLVCTVRTLLRLSTAEQAARAAEKSLTQQLQDMRRLHEVTLSLAREGVSTEGLQEILAAAAEMAGTSKGVLYLRAEDGDALELAASLGLSEEFINRSNPMPPGFGPCGRAFGQRARFIVGDVAVERGLFHDAALPTLGGFVAAHSVPLISRVGQLQGALTLHFAAPHRPDEREMRLLDLYAQLAADLVGRWEAEEVLRTSQELQSRTLSLMPAGVYTCDAAGRITFFNQRAAELWGRQPKLNDGSEQYCACHKLFSLAGNPIPPLQSPMAVAVREGKSFRNLEALVERPDGTRYFASVNIDPLRDNAGTITGAINVFQDISNLKGQAAALEKLSGTLSNQAQLFDTTLSNITDLAYAFGPDERFLYANRPLLEMLGLPLEAVVGKNCYELNYPLDLADQLHAQIRHVFATGKPVTGEVVLKLGPGEAEYHEYIYNPVKDEHGRVVAMAGSTRINTERRRTERRALFLSQLSEKLIQLTSPEEILREAGRLVGEEMRVDRCCFNLWHEDLRHVTVNVDWHREGLASLEGTFDLSEFGPAGWIESLATQSVAIADIETDELWRDYVTRYRGLGVRAYATSRFARQDSGVVTIAVTAGRPRKWAAEELAFLENIVARVWPAVERARALHALRDGEQRYRELVEGLPVAVYTCDAAGEIKLFNEAAVSLWGRRPEPGEKWCGGTRLSDAGGSVIPPEQSPMARAVRENRVLRQEMVLERPSGQRREVILHPQPIRDSTGRLSGVVTVIIDITERKREELRTSFLYELAQKLSLLNEADEIMRVATSALGRRLQVHRCYFIESHEPSGQIVVHENWCREATTVSVAGVYNVTQFGGREWWEAYTRGNFAVEDVAAHPLTAQLASTYQQLAIHAYAVQPFRHSGNWLALLGVTDDRTRTWTDDELRLIEDVVARVWPMVQRARAMSALRESENDLRFALEAARLGSWEWNIATGVLRSSERCKANFGLPQEADFVDGDYTKCILADDVPRVQQTIEQAVADRRVYETEYRVVWPDGSTHWILERGQCVYRDDGSPAKIVGVNLDITERKAAEQRLREAAERLELAVDAAHLGVWSWDAASDRMQFSPRMAQIMGLPEDGEPVERDRLRAMLHPSDRERSRVANNRALATRTDYDEEYRIYRPDGSSSWIASKGRGIYDADGKPVGMLGVLQDITARKNVETYLRQQRDVLEQVVRGDSLSEILKRLTQQVESLADRRLIASILLMDPSGRVLRPAAGSQVPMEWNQTIDYLVPGPMAFSFGAAAYTGRPVLVDDIARSPLWENHRAEALNHGFKACWATPITASDGKVLGTFALYYFEPTQPTPREFEVVDIVTRTASIAIERRRDEAAVRISEERLRLATATGKVGVWDWDLVANRLTWSDSIYQIHGIAREEFDGTAEGFSRLVHPEDRASVSAAFEKAMAAGETFELEFRCVRPDGQTIWLFTNANVLREDGVAVRFAGATLDITERKRAEEALRTKEQQLSLVAGTAPILLTQCDREERFTFANRAYLEKRDLTRERVIGRRIHEVLDETSYRLIKPYIDRVLAGEKVTFEVDLFFRGELRTMEASYVPELGASGEVKGWVAAVSDITERKRVHDAVRRLAAIVESSDDAIMSRDLSGVIMSWNRGAEKLFGYSADEAVGRPVTLLIPEERKQEESAIISKILQGLSVDHYETVRLRKDGSPVAVSLSVSPIRDEHGRVTGASKIARDITTQKRYEAQLESAQAQLQLHAQSLEQKIEDRTALLREAVAQMEEFSYTVSHDLRAPLRAMNSYSQALLEDYAPQLDDTAKEYLNRIQRSSQRMERLTHDVLMYSRLVRSEVVLAKIDLREVMLDVVDQYEELQPPKAVIEIAPDLGRVIGHEVSLGQCLTNLLTNAVKFVAPGVKPQVKVFAEKRADKVRLWIEDNGIGIASEHQSRIFLIFERLHGREQYEGTGMGLAIVRKAMEKMGGSCGVTSDGKSGSRFWVELPAA